MADWTKTVDPGGTGDYSSLSLAEAGAPGAGNNIYISCFSSNGSDDTTVVNFAGTGDLVEVTGSDFPSDGQLDTTKYYLAPTLNQNNINVVTITDDVNITIKNLQIGFNGNVNSVLILILEGRSTGNNTLTVDGCILDASGGTDDGTVTRNIGMIYYYPTVWENNIMIGGNNTGYAIYARGGVHYVYNNVITQFASGIRERDTSDIDIINNALFDNTDDLNECGTGIISHNATDEGAGEDDGANGVDISGTWDSTCFTDTNGLGPDWSVQDADSPLYHKGTDVDLATDIIGTAWHATTPSIGAFEYVAAGGLSIPVAMYHYLQA